MYFPVPVFFAIASLKTKTAKLNKNESRKKLGSLSFILASMRNGSLLRDNRLYPVTYDLNKC